MVKVTPPPSGKGYFAYEPHHEKTNNRHMRKQIWEIRLPNTRNQISFRRVLFKLFDAIQRHAEKGVGHLVCSKRYGKIFIFIFQELKPFSQQHGFYCIILQPQKVTLSKKETPHLAKLCLSNFVGKYTHVISRTARSMIYFMS